MSRETDGYPDGARWTPVPDLLLARHLPEMSDPLMLKAALHVLWRVHRRERGSAPALRRADVLVDPVLRRGAEALGIETADVEPRLEAALDGLIERGLVIEIRVAGESGPERLLLINGREGRDAQRRLEAGDMVLPEPQTSEPGSVTQQANIYALYEENIGMLTPMLAEELADAEATYPESWIAESIRLAVESNVHKWSYVRAILERWARDGRKGARRAKDKAMKSIGEVMKPLEEKIAARRTSISSNAEGGGGDDGDRPEEGGDGRADCPRCGGVGWLRNDVPIGHPDFGKAFPCDCIAAELAERRLSSARSASNMGNLGRMTFENFRVEAAGNAPAAIASLQSAHEAALGLAAQPEGWLLLSGGYGCGKTHLAAAIVNRRVADGHSALFVVVPDLLDHLRAAYAPGAEEGFDARLDAVRNAPLLVLDDLGTEAPTPWAAEKLFQILNHRYNARMATVFTTNHAVEDLDERLRSRLGELGFVRHCLISALDYRGGIRQDGTELSSLGLYDEARFQTWDHRTGELNKDLAKNLADAFRHARNFAEQPQGWLAFVGGHGSGKTHLAAAIANQRMVEGNTALFVTVPDLLDHLRATFSPSSRVRYDKRFEEVRTSPLLVLDDLGTESATPWAQEKLYQVLNHRHAAGLPTVITIAAQDARDPLRDVQPRLRSRLLDRRRCRVFHILAPAYTGSVPRADLGRRP